MKMAPIRNTVLWAGILLSGICVLFWIVGYVCEISYESPSQLFVIANQGRTWYIRSPFISEYGHENPCGLVIKTLENPKDPLAVPSTSGIDVAISDMRLDSLLVPHWFLATISVSATVVFAFFSRKRPVEVGWGAMLFRDVLLGCTIVLGLFLVLSMFSNLELIIGTKVFYVIGTGLSITTDDSMSGFSAHIGPNAFLTLPRIWRPYYYRNLSGSVSCDIPLWWFMPIMLLAVLIGEHRVRSCRRRFRCATLGTCGDCGYDLRATFSGKCPECGAVFYEKLGKEGRPPFSESDRRQ